MPDPLEPQPLPPPQASLAQPGPLAAIPGLPATASARILGLLLAEPAVREVWLYGFRAIPTACG